MTDYQNKEPGSEPRGILIAVESLRQVDVCPVRIGEERDGVSTFVAGGAVIRLAARV